MLQLFHAKVMHRRFRPRENRFVYPVLYLAQKLGEARAECRFLKFNQRGLYAFYEVDHGPRDGSALLPWIQQVLAEHGITAADGDVWLVAHPRQLGYVFNPVTFWFCEDAGGALRAVLAEVNNTFGEHHSYLIAHSDQRPIGPDDWLEARKVFHVSPFLPVEGKYQFRFSRNEKRETSNATLGIWITYHDASGKMLETSQTGTLGACDDAALLRHFLRHPLMTFAVIARIHWQAVKLWYKGARFYTKPNPPTQEFTKD